MLRIFIYLFILISTFPAGAKNHVILMGGGGEPAGQTTIFDYQLSRIGRYTRSSSNQQIDISFNGGHSTTENLLRENFPGNRSTNFTSSNYEALIAKYETEMMNGNIKPGEKILLMINTHGAERDGSEATHQIATSGGEAIDLKNLTGSPVVSLDRLQRLSRLAEEKGIKLGILDFSCHSGATISLANTRTCVISASGSKSFAFGGSSDTTFASQFTGKMVPGKNLEEIFLAARGASSDLSFPMISTLEGNRLQNKLYPVLRSYINNFYLEDYDKFSGDVESSVDGVACIQEREEVQEILQLSRHLESVHSTLELQDFRTALKEYSDYRRKVQRDLVFAGGTIMDEVTKVCARPGECVNASNRNLLSTDESELPSLVEDFKKTTIPELREHYRAMINFKLNLRKARLKLLSDHPGMRRHANFFKNYPDIINKTNELAQRVATESRKLYSAMYRPYMASNACREFTL